jgi:hypothetical protein
LGSKELKELFVAVKTERERRGKRNPANHAPPVWTIPKKAVNGAANVPN